MLTILTTVLIAGGAKPRIDNYIAAIRSNDLASLARYTKAGGTTASDRFGNTPLIVAAIAGSPESVRSLLKAGASPNKPNEVGMTPLMAAAGSLPKVKILVQAGARVKQASNLEHTALELASSFYGNAATVEYLARHGGNPNAKNKAGMTPLMNACGVNDLEMVKTLVRLGAKVNATSVAKATPLLVASGADRDNGPLVTYLLKRGANAKAILGEAAAGVVQNGPVKIGRLSALHFAATTSIEAVGALIRAGTPIDTVDMSGYTPLQRAVGTDRPNLDIIRLLVAKGAKREKALSIAKKFNNPGVLALLGVAQGSMEVGPIDSSAESSIDGQLLKDAIAKAAKTNQGTAGAFFKTGGCISCHAQIANGIAVASLQKHRIGVQPEAEIPSIRGMQGAAGFFGAAFAQFEDPGGNYLFAANGLTYLAAGNVAGNFDTDRIVRYLLANQHGKGDWASASLVRPPLEDGPFTLTANAILAVRHYGTPALKAQNERAIARAVAYLNVATPVTTEDYSMRILGLRWAGQPVPQAWVKELLARQESSGGWSQTKYLDADALATARAMIALKSIGYALSKAVEKGSQFLVSTQQADGTWHVASRALGFQPYFESGFPYGHDQWISQHATGLAMLALAPTVTKTAFLR